MEQRLKSQPSGVPESTESKQEILAQSIEGHGRVLLVREFWKEDDCCMDLQNFPELTSTHQLSRSLSTRATRGHGSSSNCSRRGLKRSGHNSADNSEDNSECPAAKSKRSAEKAGRSQCKFADRDERETPRTWPNTPSSVEAENPAPGCGAVGQQLAAPQQGAQLLLVLCRASALCTQLPRLQLVLEQVRARDCRLPAALIGILVQPQPDEEAEARRRLENLLCGIFAQHNPAVEVHTAVFCPGRPQGALDVQRAASQVRKVPPVDRGTQMDGGYTIMKKSKKKKSETRPRRDSSVSPRGSSDSSMQQPSSESTQPSPGPGSTTEQVKSPVQPSRPQKSSPENSPQQSTSQALPAPEAHQSSECPSSPNTNSKATPPSRKTDLQESVPLSITPELQALGSVAVALGALGAAYYIIESL